MRDYADYTRARAGIGKARGQRLFDGDQKVVHVTVAGISDVPIAGTDLLDRTRDPGQLGDPCAGPRGRAHLLLLVLRAVVKVGADHS